MPQIGPAEILVIVLVALLVFGPNKLPEIGRQVGSALRQLRSFQETVKGELDEVLRGDTTTSASSPASGPTPSETVTAAVEPPEVSPPALPAPEPPSATPVPPVPPAGRAPSRFRAPAQPPPSA